MLIITFSDNGYIIPGQLRKISIFLSSFVLEYFNRIMVARFIGYIHNSLVKKKPKKTTFQKTEKFPYSAALSRIISNNFFYEKNNIVHVYVLF